MEIREELEELRAKLDKGFSPETSNTGDSSTSKGHCAAVAYIVHRLYGGDYLSTNWKGESHWFNLIPYNGEVYEVCLTSDQFDRLPPIMWSKLHECSRGLYPDTVVRDQSDLGQKTIDRAWLLADYCCLDLKI
tara:strand:+ start:190 stop:588 length:399 start_codon:yes stop_codon:yes gene_type:complete